MCIYLLDVSLGSCSESVSEPAWCHIADFLRDEEKIPEFEGGEATTKFIRIIDKAFDMLNSRHPLAKGFKAPVRLSNLHMWLQQCEEIVQYLLSLRDKDGILIHNNRRDMYMGLCV